tara:strand:- start:439 stop:2256 length:1818 start_codon:yes stop_codon:yes gene_type:complete
MEIHDLTTDRLGVVPGSLDLYAKLGPIHMYKCVIEDDVSFARLAIFETANLGVALVEQITAAIGRWCSNEKYDLSYFEQDKKFYVLDRTKGSELFKSCKRSTDLHGSRLAFVIIEVARISAQYLVDGNRVVAIDPIQVLQGDTGEVALAHGWLSDVMGLIVGKDGADGLRFNPQTLDRNNVEVGAVYAVGVLLSRLGNELMTEGLPYWLDSVASRATNLSGKRYDDLRALALDIEEKDPSSRSNVIFSERRIVDRQRTFPLAKAARINIGRVTVPEDSKARLNGWMIGTTIATVIVAFLLILPRIDNPLTPIVGLIDEMQVALTAPEKSTSGFEKTENTITVPNLLNRQLTEAQVLAGQLGVRLAVDDAFDSKVVPGTVIAQDPPAGSYINQDVSLKIVVSSGEASAFLVSVVGRSVIEAREILSDLGFIVVETRSFHPDIAAGIVITQDPIAGQVRARGEQVILEASKGSELISIPRIIGISEESAKKMITELGLKFVADTVHDGVPGIDIGQVISQDPGSGSVVELDSLVTAGIFEPAIVLMPNLVGIGLNEALIALTNAELVLSRIKSPASDPVLPVVVKSQSPIAGTKVSVGDSVILTTGN